jgi:hypothetical protein
VAIKCGFYLAADLLSGWLVRVGHGIARNW